MYKLLLGAFVGSLSTLLLFFPITSVVLFFFKIFLSIIMVFISFGFKNIRYIFKNWCYLYMTSIILGGFLYFLNIEFSYKNNGLVFFQEKSINAIFLIIVSPIILYFYIKQNKELKTINNYYHKVTIYLKEETINCVGYLDTGNKLVDPYFRRSVLLVNKNMVKSKTNFNILVPYHTIGNNGFIECINPIKIEIDGKRCKALVGVSKEVIKIEGVDCLLPYKIMEGIC